MENENNQQDKKDIPMKRFRRKYILAAVVILLCVLYVISYKLFMPDSDSQPQPVTSDSDQNETAELPTDQEADLINTAQTSGYIDYVAELNKLGIAGRSESDNAAPLHQKAIELYVTGPSELMKLVTTGWPTDFSTDEKNLLRQWVQSNSEALSQLELAINKPYYWYQLSSPERTVIAILMPNLADYRNLIYALMTRAKLSAAEGNIDNAIVDIVTCYRVGLHIQTGGPKSLIEQLVGIAIRSLAAKTAFDILDRTKLNKDLLKALQSQIEECSTNESYIPDFRSEKFSLLDTIQRIFTDDGKGDGRIDLSGALILSEVIAMSSSGTGLNSSDVESRLQELSRRQTTETVEKSYQHIDTLVRKSQWQIKSENVDWMEMAKENLLVEAFLPGVAKISEIFTRCKADTEGLITTLAVLRYQSDKGQFPENLNELVTSGYLKALPSDPFSDKIFMYKRTDGESFMLYSFGINLEDDGGKVGLKRDQPNKWAKNGDAVFWPVQR